MAENEFKKALQLNPDLAEARYNLEIIDGIQEEAKSEGCPIPFFKTASVLTFTFTNTED